MISRRLSVWLAAFFVSAAMLCGWSLAAPLLPSPSPRYVQDEAKWLGAHAYSALDLKLEWFERETSNQVIVGIYQRLPAGEELFDYSQRIFDAWMPGQKAKDNGVLLLVFAADRKIRIHTGYGLEGALPDARAGRIIREVIAPGILAGDREAAIGAGVDAIIDSLKGEYEGDGGTNLDHPEGFAESVWPVVLVAGFLLLGLRFPVIFEVADVIFSAMGSSRSRSGGGSWGGSSSSGGGGFSGGGGRSGGGGASGGW